MKVREHPSLQDLRQPPHSDEAEASLLGALLLDNSAFERVSWLASNAFYADRHRRLWETITGMIEAGRAADLVTVCEELGDGLEKAGGAAYLAGLTQNTPSAFNLHRYAELVRDKAILRTLAQRGTEVAEKALSGVTPPMELAEEAASAFLGIQANVDRGEAVGFGQAMVEAIEWEDNPVKGLSTGFPDLDRILRLMPGNLIIIAGRPSMGKTALAMNIAEHVANL